MGTIVFATVLTASFGLLLFMARAQRRLLSAAPPPAPASLPPVSILKPLKGVDPSLERNLESFFRLDYPEYEIVLGTIDPGDSALDVARRVRQAHPNTVSCVTAHARAEGRLPEESVAANPKVANLTHLARRARHPVILVSDSNVEVPPGYLRDLAAHLARPGTGLVSSPVLGVPGSGLGPAMESLHLNTFVMGGVAALSSMPGGVCVVGKSMLMRREDLEAFGGFPFLGRFLAEDQVCGEEMARRGRGVVVSGIPVRNVLGPGGAGTFAARHLRWARIRRRVCPAGYFGEILLNPVALALAGFALLPAATAAAVLSGTVLAKAALDAASERRAGVRRPLLHYPPLVAAKDLLVALLWPLPFLPGTVAWRGREFRIGPRTLLLPSASGTVPLWSPFASATREGVGEASSQHPGAVPRPEAGGLSPCVHG